MPSSAVVRVFSDLPECRVSRYLYGQFIEHIGRCIYNGIWVGEGSPIPNDRGIRLDTAEVLKRLKALPGFGEQKARIFLALLGKQYGGAVPGWRAAAGEYGDPGTYLSVADIVDGPSLKRVRAHKKQLKQATKVNGKAAR